MKRELCWMGVFCIVLCSLAQAQSVDALSDSKTLFLYPATEEAHLLPYLEVLPKKFNTVSKTKILDGVMDGSFIPLNESLLFSDGKIKSDLKWMRLRLESRLPQFSEWKFFPISRFHLVDTIDVYISNENGKFDLRRTGRSLPLSEKDAGGFRQVRVKGSTYGVTIQLNPNEQKTVYVKIAAKPGNLIPLQPSVESMFYFIAQNEAFWFRRNLIQGIFHGMLLMFALFNLVSFFTQKDKIYLFYSFFVISLSVASMCLPGVKMDQVFFPQLPVSLNFLGTAADNSSIIFYLIFLLSFLNVKSLLPGWWKVIRGILIFHVIFLAFRLLLFHFNLIEHILVPLNLWIILGIIFILIFFFSRLLRTGDKLSGYMVIGSGFLALGAAFHIFEILGFYSLPWKSDLFPYPSVYVLQMGIIMQLITFSLGLGVRARMRKDEQLNLKTREAQRSKFFTDISHEIRIPLNLISDPIRSLLLQSKDEKTIKTLEMVDRNAQRILKLMSELLELARIDAGQMTLVTMETDLCQFAKAFAAFFESHAQSQSIDIEIVTPKVPLMVYVDREKIEIILFNLISNALKHTEQGQKIILVVEKDENNHLALISVHDSGPGISPEELKNLFKRFYTTSSGKAGYGIGLALSKELAELHKGYIKTTNHPDGGAEFKIALPLGSGHLLASQIIEERTPEDLKLPVGFPVAAKTLYKPKKSTLHSSHDKAHLLIVEDHPDLLSYLDNRLSALGFKVIKSNNGEDGYRKAVKKIPDIIISEVVMPGMSGYDLCKKIKTNELTSHIPVILLTGGKQTHDIIMGLGTGADVHIAKPFKMNELVAYMKNQLANRRLLKEKFSNGFLPLFEAEGLTKSDHKFLDKINKAILNNLDNENYDIKSLMRDLAISRTQLHRKIKSISDKSASHYIRDFKLMHAHELLKNSYDNVTEAAEKVGFKDLSYFSKCFKEKFGYTPSSLKS